MLINYLAGVKYHQHIHSSRRIICQVLLTRYHSNNSSIFWPIFLATTVSVSRTYTGHGHLSSATSKYFTTMAARKRLTKKTSRSLTVKKQPSKLFLADLSGFLSARPFSGSLHRNLGRCPNRKASPASTARTSSKLTRIPVSGHFPAVFGKYLFTLDNRQTSPCALYRRALFFTSLPSPLIPIKFERLVSSIFAIKQRLLHPEFPYERLLSSDGEIRYPTPAGQRVEVNREVK